MATFLQIQDSGPPCCLLGGQLAFFSEHSSSNSSKSQLSMGSVPVSLTSSEGKGRKGGWGWNSLLGSTTVESKRAFFSWTEQTLCLVSSRQCLLRAQEGVRLGYHCGQCHHTRGSPARWLSQFLHLCLGPHLTHSHLPHGVPRVPGQLSQSVPHARMPSTDTSTILIYQPKHLHSSRVVERNDQGENAVHPAQHLMLEVPYKFLGIEE